MPRDLPIMFSAPMVLALLAGRKTQTRRLATSPLARAEPGDRLWVRENFWHAPAHMGFDRTHGAHGHVAYSAGPGMTADAEDRARAYGVKQRPSIRMPRWASRLTLVVTEVRRQSLVDITDADALAEGVVEVRQPDRDGYRHFAVPGTVDREWPTPRAAFAGLWERLHGPQSWMAETWVVALSFTVHRVNIDQMEVSDAA